MRTRNNSAVGTTGAIRPAAVKGSSRTAARSLVALAVSMACGQAAQAQQASQLEEVVVTGTRVERAGFEAPTPLTVMGIQEMESSPTSNLAEFVNTLPSVIGSATPQNSNTSISSGAAGVSALNLRALGTVRTLVLVDGQRSVGSLLNGTVDVNTIPQALVSRVEVVTGGASAAYGSDAVAGVVNFVLDRRYTGFKLEADGGQTSEGDNESWKTRLAWGMPFSEGRGHVLLSGEYVNDKGVMDAVRDWNDDGCYQINNPAYVAGNGEPERLVTCGASLSEATYGGIITNTALRGTAFGPGGTPYLFDYGTVRSPWMIGGQWESNQVNDRQSLNPEQERQGLFARLSWGFTENIEGFLQASWNNADTTNITGVQFNQGNIIIRADNAFLPESVRQAAQTLGITQFNLGSMNGDLPLRLAANDRTVTRIVAGLDGDAEFWGTGWSWNAYYQWGEAESTEMAKDITNNSRLALAADAVFSPTGAIVCRSTLTNPDNGCVPFNRMGTGVNTQAALDYVLGNPYRDQTIEQNVAAASISGDPFSTWAGPVSVATGIEWREEKVSGYVPEEFQRGWFVGNYLPNFGKYDVTEAFLETVVPLASNKPMAKSLELNAAVRGTDYSTSGSVTTWKVGATWAPIDDIRFRATVSRDIRAPNLQELFASGTSNTNNVIDPFNNNQSVQYRGVNRGNPNLEPEEADQWGVGIVLQPTAIPGFSASIDYYEIELAGAIGSLSAQEIVDRCFEGNQVYCDAITRGTAPGGAQVITEIAISPFNLAERVNRGIDLEMSYRVPVAGLFGAGDSELQFRLLGTRFLENFIDDGIVEPTDTAGQNTGDGPPDWIVRASVAYLAGPVSTTLTARGVSDGVYDNSFVECTSGCPASTSTNRTINDNDIDGQWVFDLNLSYEFMDSSEMSGEVYLNVKNLLDEDPPIVGYGPAGSAYGTPSTNPTLFEQLGRAYRLGVRFKM
jgi:outer membrane receptor protein involved in Fe transport